MTRLVPPLAASLALTLALAACGGTDIVDHGAPAGSSGSSGGSSELPAGEPPSGADAGADASTEDAAPSDAGADASTTSKSYNLGSSAGCGNAAAGTGLQDRTRMVGGIARRYLRFIPPGYQPNKPYALVFGYHGSGGTADKARATMGLEAEAAGKAIFIYPQGVPDPAFMNDNRWDPAKGSDDYTFLDEMIAEISASHCIDRDRVFVTGFSNGARMTSMIGCYRGDVVRAIAPVAPGGTSTTLPLAAGGCVGEVGVWEGLGTEDPDHLEGAALVRDFYRVRNGCAATRTQTTPAACQAYDGCRAAVPSVWCSYPGPHAWPAIGAAGVWDFFATFK